MTGRQETYLAFAIVLASSLAYWLAVSSTPSGAPEELVLEAITNQNLPKVRAHAELAAARALVEAARRYQRAAEQGSVDAQMTLGGLYAAGEGVAKDDAEAARWYRRAVTVGDVDMETAERILKEADCSAEEADAIYRLTALNTEKERIVIPPAHREEAVEALQDPMERKQSAGFGFLSGPERGM